MNINEVESKFAQKLNDPLRDILGKLSYSLPKNYHLHITLHDANGRKKNRNASANNWSPEHGGRIEIRFEPVAQGDDQATLKDENVAPTGTEVHPASSPLAGTYVHPAEVELLRALDRAESKPGWNFVPLKKFRDEILPMEHCPSMRTDVEQRSMLNSAIEKRLVLTSKVQNPKSPQFPVTTIRLNRLMPEVKAALGQTGGVADLDFRPVEIRGEPLSTTILRERR